MYACINMYIYAYIFMCIYTKYLKYLKYLKYNKYNKYKDAFKIARQKNPNSVKICPVPPL